MVSYEIGADERIYARITATDDEDFARGLVRNKHEVKLDEPPHIPFGNDTAPCPADYLLLATGGCQVEVLRQAFQKARIVDYEITLDLHRNVEYPENAPENFPEHTALRYPSIDMKLDVSVPVEYEDIASRCLEVADDACIVSQSVEQGIDINLTKQFQTTGSAD